MATTKTRAQFVAMAADELGIVGSGQSLADEDEDKIDSRVDGLFAELAAREVIFVQDDEAIPVEHAGPLAELLANECAQIFGKQKMSVQAREGIEDRLRVMLNRIAASNKYLEVDTELQRRQAAQSYTSWVSDT